MTWPRGNSPAATAVYFPKPDRAASVSSVLASSFNRNRSPTRSFTVVVTFET
jgi:hypothetical protein